jgi:uncharacterized membrane protein YjjP (DUF1212 family)
MNASQQEISKKEGKKKSPQEVTETPLDRKTLADIVEIALSAGQLLVENGAESRRVEETIRTLGTGLGCDWGDVYISYDAIVVSHSSRKEFRTKIRHVNRRSVDMTLIAAISHLAHRVAKGQLDRFMVRSELRRIRTTPRLYNRWQTILTVGLACAAFSRLFGGDWLVFAVTLFAASGAMFVRQLLAHRGFNPLLVVATTATVAGLLVGLFHLLQLISQPGIALAASVLLLVPGVPFINAVEDLIKGHVVVGLAQAATGVLIILAIALGLIFAMQLTGIKGL